MNNCLTFNDFAARLREFIARPVEAQFNPLAVNLFQLQFRHNPVFADLCAHRGILPEFVSDWRQIPALPAVAFKEFAVTSLAESERSTVFHSSGTTEQIPGRHFHDAESLALYEASLLPWFQKHLLPDAPSVRIVSLTPSASAAPHSSLVHMFATAWEKLGACDSTFTGKLEAQGAWLVDGERTVEVLKDSIARARPTVLLGTAFTLVHFLDFLVERSLHLRLPAGSRVLETGGYKGRSRALAKDELHRFIADRLGVAPSHIVCEYGMSELSSQAYDRVAGSEEPRVFRFPPWARARIISPETGRDVADGETGLIQILDLANMRSAMNVLTEDLGARRGDGIELRGRVSAAEARGCSLMTV
ncbi:MAG: hypothetical protein AB1705_20425 [Verrucomicrobiota bacterium]